MSPTAIVDNAPIAADPANLKAKLVAGQVEVEKASPPVADNFMYDFKYNHALPTIDVLGQDIAADVNAQEVAQELLAKLEQALGAGDAAAFTGLFIDYGVWRDKLSFTWDYRTFNFKDAIGRAAGDLLPTTKARNLSFLAPSPNIQRPYDDLSYLQFSFSFDTDLVNGSAVVNAIQTTEGWKLWTLYTSIESLLQFPPVPPADGHMIGTTSFEKQRAKFIDEVKPDVLIIGGGQNGLAMSAQMKHLGVSNLILERDSKVGGVWIDRYEYLSLHAPHYADHLPFMDLPKLWPVYTPAQKFGRFFQSYVDQLDLPIWLSSQVIKAEKDEAGQWTVQIAKAGETRTLHPKHVVMATSLCGVPTTPVIPGMAEWQGGVYRHSSAHDSSKAFLGKKVCVVGTSSSGFDTAFEAARLGIDVTLLQRSPTYVMSLEHSMPRILANYWPDKNGVRPDLDIADRLSMSMPNGPAEEFGRRQAVTLEELDKDLLDGLHAKGFKTWRGQRGTGNSTLGQTRNGGFYFEAGACQAIIDGKINVEQGFIERFTKDKVILSGGRETHFDLIVFATGFSNTIDSVRATLGEDIASRCGPIWGVDEEGEIKTAYKETGVDGLWLMLGYLPMTRYHSKRLALRIKALLEGIAPAPYKA